MTDIHNVVIIGSGIAGLSAAVYCARNGHNPLIIHGDEPGGQLTLTSEVANYPGFPDSVGGTELIQKMQTQAEKFGAELKHGVVEKVNDESRPFEIKLSTEDIILSKSIIVASGASARTLDIPGENELMGYGLSTCATCDGAFFKDEEMVVVGGGDAALEEAHYLTKFASKVYLIHRREEFRGNSYLQDQVERKVENKEIDIIKNTELTKINGSKKESIDSIDLVTNEEGHPINKLDSPNTKKWNLEVGAVFFAIGHTPNTSYLTDTDVEVDDTGYIKVSGGLENVTETDVQGIFAAGDVVDYHYQQASTAAGMGVKAALDVDNYLD